MSTELHSLSILSGFRNNTAEFPEISPGFPFREAIPSFCCHSNGILSYTAEIQARTVSGKTSEWLYIGSWNRKAERKLTEDGGIRTETDILISSEDLSSCRIRITSEDPTLMAKQIAVSFSRSPYVKGRSFNDKFIPDEKILDIPFRSQTSEKESIRNRICSPTSVCAVMEYFGEKAATEKFAEEIYDEEYGIFGVWWRAVQGAAAHGFSGSVRHFKSLYEAYEFIKEGIPVICCISYEKGELKGSHTERSDGHVITLCGFTKDGMAVCSDSAAPEGFGLTRYRLEEFRKAWLYSGGGIGYIITPWHERNI